MTTAERVRRHRAMKERALRDQVDLLRAAVAALLASRTPPQSARELAQTALEATRPEAARA